MESAKGFAIRCFLYCVAIGVFFAVLIMSAKSAGAQELTPNYEFPNVGAHRSIVVAQNGTITVGTNVSGFAYISTKQTGNVYITLNGRSFVANQNDQAVLYITSDTVMSITTDQTLSVDMTLESSGVADNLSYSVYTPLISK